MRFWDDPDNQQLARDLNILLQEVLRTEEDIEAKSFAKDMLEVLQRHVPKGLLP